MIGHMATHHDQQQEGQDAPGNGEDGAEDQEDQSWECKQGISMHRATVSPYQQKSRFIGEPGSRKKALHRHPLIRLARIGW